MKVRWSAALLLVLLAGGACGGGLFREYEYDEETFLRLDGSATVVVSSSLAALHAMHGLDVPTDPQAPIDRAAIGALFESPVTEVVRVSRPWQRYGRRFVSVRVRTSTIDRLDEARPFQWSRYSLTREAQSYVYRQRVGAPTAEEPSDRWWQGDELVAFRLHLPSQVLFHNSPSGEVGRGNLIAWEQTIAERLAGRPVDIEVRLGTQTILYRTLIVFGGALAAATLLLVFVAWWIRRAGRALDDRSRDPRRAASDPRPR